VVEHLVLISADGHAGPPVATYRDYLDPEVRDEFDAFLVQRDVWRAERNRAMGLGEDEELVHALFGEEMVDRYSSQDAVRSGGCTGVFDSARRTAELEAEGIVGEVLFADFQNSNEPPWGAAFPYPDTTPQQRRAGSLAFNRWLAEFCAELPGRRAGVALVQPHDVDTATSDIRDARAIGLASVMLPTGDVGLPPYLDRCYDPIWAACVEEDLPVTFHSGGIPWQGYGPEATCVSKIELTWWARRPLWQMIFGAVFERFPRLRVAFTEQGADWIPAMLERLDEQYSSPFERAITERLHRTPSQYWRSNCFVGASFMSRAECDVRGAIGVDRIMWGADYPHIEGTWPRSLAVLREACVGCSADEIRTMTSQTAAAVYGFDLEALQSVAQRCSPTIESLVTPAAPPPVTYSPVDYALGKVSGKETGRRLFSYLSGGSTPTHESEGSHA
jgi:predicted TIM-barrel fold metal-dependent hydrolase